MQLRRACTIGRYRATWHHWTRITYHRQERFGQVRRRYGANSDGTVRFVCTRRHPPERVLVSTPRRHFDAAFADWTRMGYQCTILRVR